MRSDSIKSKNVPKNTPKKSSKTPLTSFETDFLKIKKEKTGLKNDFTEENFIFWWANSCWDHDDKLCSDRCLGSYILRVLYKYMRATLLYNDNGRENILRLKIEPNAFIKLLEKMAILNRIELSSLPTVKKILNFQYLISKRVQERHGPAPFIEPLVLDDKDEPSTKKSRLIRSYDAKLVYLVFCLSRNLQRAKTYFNYESVKKYEKKSGESGRNSIPILKTIRVLKKFPLPDLLPYDREREWHIPDNTKKKQKTDHDDIEIIEKRRYNVPKTLSIYTSMKLYFLGEEIIDRIETKLRSVSLDNLSENPYKNQDATLIIENAFAKIENAMRKVLYENF